MQRESINTKTFAKGLGAVAVAAVTTIGALQFTDYSTASVDYSFVPGTYTASAKGMESDVKVTITVDESSITDVQIDVSGETKGIGADIGDTVTSQILDGQSAEIDGVTGATVSSTAVKTALEEAIAKAEAGDASAPETEAAATEAAAEEASTEAAAMASSASGSYTPGTYTAEAQGIESTVTVTGTFDETALTDVQIDVSGETAGLGAEVGAPLSESILSAQSSDVEGVSGATITSDAVKNAMNDVFAQASAGGEAVAEEASTEAATMASSASGSYTPGTYTAEAQGIESTVTVTGTFDETALTDVQIDVSGETAGLGAEVGAPLSESILSAQSSDVEGVSGATITSEAVKNAMNDVFAQASAGGEAVAEEASTEAAEMAEAETAAEAAMDADEETSGKTISASAQGMESIVKVIATFDGDKLVDLQIDVSGETPDIGAAAGDPLAESILAAQSADVEGVSGATVTSDAVKAAMANIFAQVGSADTAEAAEEETEAKEMEAAKEETVTVTDADADGVYAASAQGLESIVKVIGTFDGDKLTDVQIDVSGETAGLGADVGAPLSESFLSAQSADVEGVSGATITSDAVKAAMSNIFAQAQK